MAELVFGVEPAAAALGGYCLFLAFHCTVLEQVGAFSFENRFGLAHLYCTVRDLTLLCVFAWRDLLAYSWAVAGEFEVNALVSVALMVAKIRVASWSAYWEEADYTWGLLVGAELSAL